MKMLVAFLIEAERHRLPCDAVGRRCAGTIVSGSGGVTLVAQVMLGITTQQLTFVTSNRALDFGGDPARFSFRFINAHASSYAPQPLTCSYSTKQSDHLVHVEERNLWLRVLKREVGSVRMTKSSKITGDGGCLTWGEVWARRLRDDAGEAQRCASRVLVDFKKSCDPSQFEHDSGTRQHGGELDLPITFRRPANTLQKHADADRIYVLHLRHVEDDLRTVSTQHGQYFLVEAASLSAVHYLWYSLNDYRSTRTRHRSSIKLLRLDYCSVLTEKRQTEGKMRLGSLLRSGGFRSSFVIPLNPKEGLNGAPGDHRS